jgi:hypothetical protein
MPFEIIDSLDPLAALVEFRTSAVYEMVMSARTLIKPSHHQRRGPNGQPRRSRRLLEN